MDRLNMTSYLRNALVSKKDTLIDFKNEEKNFQIISYSQFNNGKIDYEVAQELNHNKTTVINVIVAAKTVRMDVAAGRVLQQDVEELTGVYYIPAKMNAIGDLLFDSDRLPWIPREFLSPMVVPQLSMGLRESFDHFLQNTTDRRIKIENWKDYIQYCSELYRYVTNSSLWNVSAIINGEHIDFERNMYIFKDESINTDANIRLLYDNILKEYKSKKIITLDLYEKLIKPEVRKSKKSISNLSTEAMIKHNGQMGGEYPLAESQRAALNHYNKLSDGDILAISGPPGTGKTTLLQSIVADTYVNCAINKRQAPIIIAASTNNQAVTNIIDSFGKIDSIGLNNLEERWIDGVNSFALYFPSSGRAKEAIESGYQVTDNYGSHFATEIEDSELKKKSTEKYIRSTQRYLSKYRQSDQNTIAKCQNNIHNELLAISSCKATLIKQLKHIDDITEGKGVVNLLKEIESEINEYTNFVEGIKNQINDNELRIQNYKHRIEEWKVIYNKLPCLLRWFGFLPFIKKKIYRELKINQIATEIDILQGDLLLEDIIDIYIKCIEDTNRNIVECNINKESMLQCIAKLIERKEALHHEINKVKNHLINLKEYGCDIWNVVGAKSEEKKANIEKIVDTCDIAMINELLDTRVRYIEFWLAVHFYEGTFLIEEGLTDDERRSNKENNVVKFFHRMALLTPCMVMTFFILPKNFRVYSLNDRVQTYLYNFIDLLIVDEAGQVTPEIAAPSFSLAKKAVVVGDEKQIPPVWGISKALDMALAIEDSVINTIDEFETLVESGCNTSESSVMRVAKNSCDFEDYGKGLFLREHRRCYNEIIQYCNELVYKNNLLPLRGEGEDDLNYPLRNKYPLLGHKNIEVSQSTRKGTSRVNYQEAEAIAIWLSNNYDEIINAYLDKEESLDIKQVLAIITPFKEQVSVINQKLSMYMSDNKKNITVGTVHTFQGAERRIIIMSTVYGKDDGCYFINVNRSLMNVAISRAKDAFWVFGSYECLDKSKDSVSGLLRHYVQQEIE